jgi:hypothetical protein
LTEPSTFPASTQPDGRRKPDDHRREPTEDWRPDEGAPEQRPEAEEVDALPVLAQARAIDPPPTAGALAPIQSTAVQAAAVAATGFVAGAATAAVLRRRSRRRAARRAQAQRSPARRAGELAQVVASRSFLIDVHLLGGGD